MLYSLMHVFDLVRDKILCYADAVFVVVVVVPVEPDPYLPSQDIQ